MTQRTLFSRTHCATQRQATRTLRYALAAAGVCLLSVASSATGLAAARPNPAISQATYQALFNQLSAEPLHYGGLASAHNRRILIGLHQTGTGTVAGEMMRLDSAMRPLDAGPVTGTLTAPGSAQLSHCHLNVTLSDRDITLDGPCSPTLLSGALTTRPRPSQLWSQVTNFISPDTSVSQYWLSRDTWQAAVTPAATP